MLLVPALLLLLASVPLLPLLDAAPDAALDATPDPAPDAAPDAAPTIPSTASTNVREDEWLEELANELS